MWYRTVIAQISDVDQFNLDAEKYNKMLEEKAKKSQPKKNTQNKHLDQSEVKTDLEK